MNRVIHFEIHSSDPEKAAEFYGSVFGWKFEEWVIPGVVMRNEYRYWVVTTGGEGCGINGGLVFRRGQVPTPSMDANAFVCTIDVASLEESLARAVAAGATITSPKMPIRGVGWLAYCTDLDGNTFGLMQEDPEAH
jgi:predicted enzyme related to lactoylglutathione lyase